MRDKYRKTPEDTRWPVSFARSQEGQFQEKRNGGKRLYAPKLPGNGLETARILLNRHRRSIADPQIPRPKTMSHALVQPVGHWSYVANR